MKIFELIFYENSSRNSMKIRDSTFSRPSGALSLSSVGCRSQFRGRYGMFTKVVLRALLASRKKNTHRESFCSLLQLGDLIANFRTYFGLSVSSKQVLIRCIYRYEARKLTPYRSLTSFRGRQGENHGKIMKNSKIREIFEISKS